ncbi:hypothetical protein IFM60648_08468 [Aspergillus lentulus]|uniref:Uncharacterized protein n=1 Tax=Aspergillus lentulus TaxID=293939 RepID=A0ABQ1AV86_ASPLE|nr:hypothetical protein IFM62136_06899 [Aspergillus lentulus]GFF88676.1 hypothetical protein IFM60648_08468 [Aspergillus lentulus]
MLIIELPAVRINIEFNSTTVLIFLCACVITITLTHSPVLVALVHEKYSDTLTVCPCGRDCACVSPGTSSMTTTTDTDGTKGAKGTKSQGPMGKLA